MHKTELLQLLHTTKLDTLPFFDLADGALAKAYGPGKWTVRQILHHLTDTEMLLHERLKRIIAGPKQVVWAFDQDAWDHAFDYAHAPLGNKKQVYALCRELNIQLIETYYDSHGPQEFVHSETGLRTVKDEFEKVALHNQGHIGQVRRALLQ
jgi:DinB superfamily